MGIHACWTANCKSLLTFQASARAQQIARAGARIKQFTYVPIQTQKR